MGNYLSSSAPPPPLGAEHMNSLKAFSLKEITIATKRLSNVILIDGPYSNFKGWLNEQTLSPETPETGMPVIVRRLELDGFPGHHNPWLEKLNHVARLHHPNLVRIIGYCLEVERFEYRFLVSEFLPRGSLENNLYRYLDEPPPLSWNKRMKVAIGTAKGLCFLHHAQPQVIYRYLDAASILIDADYNAKLSAYLSTQVRDIQGNSAEGYSSEGYAAPEFIYSGRVSAKSDVYSFGVLLLVLLTGKHGMVNDTTTLVKWVKQFYNNLVQIMDTNRIMKNYPQKAAVTIAKLALDCTYDSEHCRPDMSDVLRRLEDAVKPKKYT